MYVKEGARPEIAALPAMPTRARDGTQLELPHGAEDQREGFDVQRWLQCRASTSVAVSRRSSSSTDIARRAPSSLQQTDRWRHAETRLRGGARLALSRHARLLTPDVAPINRRGWVMVLHNASDWRGALFSIRRNLFAVFGPNGSSAGGVGPTGPSSFSLCREAA